MKTEVSSFFPNHSLPEPYVSAQEAALFLSISPKTLTRLAREGAIPAHPLGNGIRRRWRFLKSELDTWMHARVNSKNHLRSHLEETQ
jgi:excisionase family DNA binding protein